MTSINPPKPLPCPDSWKYTQDWKDRYEEKHGEDYLSKMCKHSEAGFNIMYYICDMGEIALTKIKTQNLVIKRINTGKVDPTEISDFDIDWQSGHTWARLDEHRDELFEIYNANMAPADILRILDEVKTFMNSGQLHCQSLLRYLADARAAFDQQKAALNHQEEMERVKTNLQIMEQSRANKWEAIDVKHSKVTDGFIYLLSNALMPGVYKIGFTAGNPDKRAREVSMNYGLPMPFEVIEYWRTKDPYIIEQRIHAALASYEKAGEFFEVDLQIVKETIEANVNKGINEPGVTMPEVEHQTEIFPIVQTDPTSQSVVQDFNARDRPFVGLENEGIEISKDEHHHIQGGDNGERDEDIHIAGGGEREAIEDGTRWMEAGIDTAGEMESVRRVVSGGKGGKEVEHSVKREDSHRVHTEHEKRSNTTIGTIHRFKSLCSRLISFAMWNTKAERWFRVTRFDARVLGAVIAFALLCALFQIIKAGFAVYGAIKGIIENILW